MGTRCATYASVTQSGRKHNLDPAAAQPAECAEVQMTAPLLSGTMVPR